MKISKDSRKLAKQLFQASFTNGRLDDSKIRELIRSIIQRKPRHHMHVLKQFQSLIRLETEKHHAVIESAVELTPETSGRVAQDLRSRHGSDLTTEFKVNADLIGGLRIRIGSDVWDGSVQGRLGRLEHQLTAV
jgi:F-type H+-transporting ATPase subunit delta